MPCYALDTSPTFSSDHAEYLHIHGFTENPTVCNRTAQQSADLCKTLEPSDHNALKRGRGPG